MKVPQALIGLKVYQEGKSEPLGVASVELPSIEAMTTTVKGAGIAGEFTTPVLGQYGDMTLKLSWQTINKNFLGLAMNGLVNLQCYGAFQEMNTETGMLEPQKVYVMIRGYVKKSDLGKLEAANGSDSATEISAQHLKVEFNDKRAIEIDKVNYVAFFDGVDYLKDVASMLG